MWMGGNVPLGYDVKDRKLVVNEPEAATIRVIFRRYAELGSVARLKAELDRQDIVSKRREGVGGRLTGGQHFSRGALYLMLQTRIYRGEIVHQGTAYPGRHTAIIEPELWQIVEEAYQKARTTAHQVAQGRIIDGQRRTIRRVKQQLAAVRMLFDWLITGQGGTGKSGFGRARPEACC
jgi:Recombinase